MLLLNTIFQLSLLLLAKAHFQLQFPAPRGAFVEDKEPTFCDGYTTPASNRTSLSMADSYISLNSEHPNWVVTVLVANSSNPTSFANFSQVTAFTQNSGEGLFCLPFSLSKTNATSLNLQDGQNVTLQIVFAADDGSLFQCADVTLSNSTTNPQPTSGCTAGNLQGGNGSSGNNSTGTSSGSNGSNGAETVTVVTATSALAVVFTFISLLLSI
ncbi:hypothetical protein V5O48_006831 [Marasmius crinis-equi]|uniref:Copper acquisition factor BIM1-like domain-containing protein n=1 Tax=Marasmius crinis-equi TaxID=585013 RepID=A0ABR3FID1_9AGAR